MSDATNHTAANHVTVTPTACRPGPSSGRVRRVADVLVSIAFCALTAVPLVAMLVMDNREDILNIELRNPASFPTVEYCERLGGLFRTPKKISLTQFPRGFEAWFNDRLAFRRRFTQLFALAKVVGLATRNFDQLTVGQDSKSGVIIGRDGQLFMGTPRFLSDFRRTETLSEQDLAGWRRLFEARGRWLAARGIPYVVMVGPNAWTIYPEFMPRSFTRLDRPSSLDLLKQQLREVDCVTFVDPSPALRQGRAHYPTYPKTDSHWNDYGAFLAYRELLHGLAAKVPGIQPWQLDQFTVAQVDLKGGDLERMIDSPLLAADTTILLTPCKRRLATVTKLPDQGDQIYRHMSTQPEAALESAVVLHDCYFSQVMPFLSEHFQTVHYEGGGRDYFPDFPVELIERVRPTVVVQEFVERRLLLGVPENPASVTSEDATQWASRSNKTQR